jgi:UDP-N-acetylglucosamine acyltransferase
MNPAVVHQPRDGAEAAIIHPLAIVEPGAVLGAGVKVGPFCHIGPHAEIGDGSELISHVVVAGRTTIGPRARIYPFASIGHPPQHLKYRGEPTTLRVGADCTIREAVTLNPGTSGGTGRTIIGDRCYLMASSHVAHDCVVGDDVVMSNNAMLAGHCVIGDFVILGGGAGIHQFVRIGPHAFIGGLSAVENDVIPYGMALGNRAYLAGLNIVGLRRRGFSREQIHDLRRAYRLLFANEGTLAERVGDVAEEFAPHPTVHEILAFIREGGERAICTPRDVAGPA